MTAVNYYGKPRVIFDTESREFDIVEPAFYPFNSVGIAGLFNQINLSNTGHHLSLEVSAKKRSPMFFHQITDLF